MENEYKGEVLTIREVTISLERYDELSTNENDFLILLDALFKCTSLSWDSKYLRFDDETVSLFLKTLRYAEYKSRLNYLISEKKIQEMEKKENE